MRRYFVDTVTQGLLGAAIGQACFRKSLGKKAAIWGALCGLSPDLDIFVRVGGKWAFYEYHRTLTHSIPVLAISAPLFGWLACKIFRDRENFWKWFHLSFWALITHPILDLFTSYGTLLFYPLKTRFAIDALPIIDPIYSGILLFPFLVPWKKSVEIKQKFAITMLILSCFYILLGYFQNRRALSLVRTQLKKINFSIKEIRATPSLFTIWVWKVMAKNEAGDMKITMVSTMFPQKKMRFYTFPKEKNTLAQKALSTKYGKIFTWFSMDMYSIHTIKEKTYNKIYMYDQRYGILSFPAISVFRSCFTFDLQGKLLDVKLLKRPKLSRENIKNEFSMLWFYFRGGTIPKKIKLFF